MRKNSRIFHTLTVPFRQSLRLVYRHRFLPSNGQHLIPFFHRSGVPVFDTQTPLPFARNQPPLTEVNWTLLCFLYCTPSTPPCQLDSDGSDNPLLGPHAYTGRFKTPAIVPPHFATAPRSAKTLLAQHSASGLHPDAVTSRKQKKTQHFATAVYSQPAPYCNHKTFSKERKKNVHNFCSQCVQPAYQL
jgi:hypothetical protein